MTRRRLAVFTIALIAFLLTAAQMPTINGYAIVDCNAPGSGFAVYPTVQQALDNGAVWVDVRDGECGAFTVNTPNVTLNFQGVTIPNDGTGTGVVIAPTAHHTTIQGNLCVVGNSDGTVLGDYDNGTGFRVKAAYATLDGICTRDLTGFDVLAVGAEVHHVTVRNCDIQGVATSPTVEQRAFYGIYFVGSSDNLVEDCFVTGKSQVVGLWYNVDRTTVRGVRAENNYGCIDDAPPSTCGARSAFENYGEGEGSNDDNTFEGNYADGTRGAGFELADVQRNTRVVGNTTRNTWGGAFGAMGSAGDYGTDYLIADNVFYGTGTDNTNWFSGSGTIRNNTFVGWGSTNLGTIFIPGDALGDVTIEGNVFDGGSRVLRYSANQGVFRFIDNRVNDVAQAWQGGIVYFVDAHNAAAYIEGNTFDGTSGRVIYQETGIPLVIRDNDIDGEVVPGAGATIEGNTIYTVASEWAPIHISSGSVVRNNRLLSDGVFGAVRFMPGTINSLIDRNYNTTYDGSPASLPNCDTANTCVGNWTAGQLP